MATHRAKILGWLGYVAVGLVMAPAFVIWAPWTSAIPLKEAEREYGRTFPADWKAVVVNHGVFRDEPWSTPTDHPVRYALLTFLLFAPPVITFAVGFRQGFRRCDLERSRDSDA